MTDPAGTGTDFTFGHWTTAGAAPVDDPDSFRAAIGDLRAPVVVVRTPHGPALARGGKVTIGDGATGELHVAAVLPPLPPERLGDPTFLNDHGLKYAYMTGAMANGIGSADIVEAMAAAGMLGSFGAAG